MTELETDKKHIHIIGDSIGEGYYDLDKSGWVNRLKFKLYESRYFYNKDYLLPKDFIRNHSLSGDTAFRARQRIRQEFLYKASDDSLNIPIVALGVNDSYIYDLETAQKIKSGEIPDGGKDVENSTGSTDSNNLSGADDIVSVSYKDFVNAYAELLSIVAVSANEANQALGKNNVTKIFVLELTPCAEQRSIPSPFDVSWVQSRIDLFNDAIKQIVMNFNNSSEFSNEFEVIPTRDLFPSNSGSDEMLRLIPDGIHPYERGHQLIADRVFTRLLQYLEQL